MPEGQVTHGRRKSVHFKTSDLKGNCTEGSTSFDVDQFLDPQHPDNGLSKARPYLEKNDFRQAIIAAFALPEDDSYVYHAVASVTLDQVQSAINAGAANGLHDWYLTPERKPIPNPSAEDIEAYIECFEPGAAPGAALASLQSNAKKGSLRKQIGTHLLKKRHVDDSFPNPKKRKKLESVPENPALDFWAWSCRNLEWAGPMDRTADVKMAHHVLPVMMHHFGCVAPSEEAFHMLAKFGSEQKEIVEIGSGNGYWSLMLRRRGMKVTAVDNQQSLYRTRWVEDTVREDGIRWLKRNNGGKGKVLLLVYPITAGDWTAEVLRTYTGDNICVVGTQNDNRYTAFSNETLESWMERERKTFRKVVQIPLPSFAGKDEALFIYQRQKA